MINKQKHQSVNVCTNMNLNINILIINVDKFVHTSRSLAYVQCKSSALTGRIPLRYYLSVRKSRNMLNLILKIKCLNEHIIIV